MEVKKDKRCNIYQGHKEMCLYTHIYLNIYLNNVCVSLYKYFVQKTFARVHPKSSLMKWQQLKKNPIWIDTTNDIEGKAVSTTNVINPLLIGFLSQFEAFKHQPIMVNV